MRYFKLALACAGIVLAGQPTFAKEAILVQPSQFDATQLLHAPPANDSVATKAELARLHRIETKRTPEESDRAATDGRDESVFLFRSVFGNGFNPDKLPVTTAFFAKVANDESVHVARAKMVWQRPRPIAIDPTLHPCAQGKSFGYPSGHATRAYVLGITLAAAVPEKRDAILDRSADYARSRLICGVHFRDDVDAGRITGTALAAVMLSMPAVREQLKAVHAELAAAGLATP